MLSRVAKLLLWMGGWTGVGIVPDEPQAIFIAAPHTSNWDGIWALVFKVSIGLDVHFFAKHSLFWFPLGPLLRSLGGIPLDRSKAGSAVQQVISAFEANDHFYFALAPEGTRRLTKGWKSGFYRMAKGANVPIFLCFLDYENKRLGIGPKLEVSDDQGADMRVCQDYYAGIVGCRPEQASPVIFTDL